MWSPPRDESPSAGTFLAQLRDWRFWAVQGLILLATSLHWWLESSNKRGPGDLHVVLMNVAYLVPVIYASLNFGRAGAIPTAIWNALLAIPNLLLWHKGLDRVAEVGQLVTIVALAVVISDRVDREVDSRRHAEWEASARRNSEARYRSLFNSAGDAILVFNEVGTVLEANAAAGELLDRPAASLRGETLSALVGTKNAAELRRMGAVQDIVSDDLQVVVDGREARWVAPVCGVLAGPAGTTVVQALLRDVTERRIQQLGMESYARHIVQAQEEERRRISREIHDNSLQAVVLLCRRLDALEATSGDLSPPIRETLSGARQSAETIGDDLRRLSRDLRPSILDDLGLWPAVRWLVSELERRSTVRGKVLLLGSERRLSSDVELCLFRIAQEGLFNVERHAEASTVEVTLAYQEHRARLTIHDNGRGLPPGQALPASFSGGHLGLLGIQERARLLGGNVRVVSRPGQGTRLRVTLPLTPAGSAE